LTKSRKFDDTQFPFMTAKTNTSDVIIIGGGPAGLSAAQWCRDLGLTAVLLEKSSEFGGQLLHIHKPIVNYLGLKSDYGLELRDKFLAATNHLKFTRVFNAEISSFDLREKTIRLADRTEFLSNAIIIATGVRRRKLGVEGEDRFIGKGILESGSKERENTRNKRVVIVGGGDAALENALILSQYAAAVTVVHRRAEFTARTEFLERASRAANIELVVGTIVRRIVGNDVVEAIEIAADNSEKSELRLADQILIRIGVQPNTELFSGQIELDPAGYVIVDRNCETSASRVFAAGDVANPVAPTISTAVGTGAIAVKAAFARIDQTN
jgi:thioredoxin reductase (NADPH)